MGSPSAILTLGLGSWGSPSLMVTLGYGSEASSFKPFWFQTTTLIY